MCDNFEGLCLLWFVCVNVYCEEFKIVDDLVVGL